MNPLRARHATEVTAPNEAIYLLQLPPLRSPQSEEATPKTTSGKNELERLMQDHRQHGGETYQYIQQTVHRALRHPHDGDSVDSLGEHFEKDRSYAAALSERHANMFGDAASVRRSERGSRQPSRGARWRSDVDFFVGPTRLKPPVPAWRWCQPGDPTRQIARPIEVIWKVLDAAVPSISPEEFAALRLENAPSTMEGASDDAPPTNAPHEEAAPYVFSYEETQLLLQLFHRSSNMFEVQDRFILHSNEKAPVCRGGTNARSNQRPSLLCPDTKVTPTATECLVHYRAVCSRALNARCENLHELLSKIENEWIGVEETPDSKTDTNGLVEDRKEKFGAISKDLESLMQLHPLSLQELTKQPFSAILDSPQELRERRRMLEAQRRRDTNGQYWQEAVVQFGIESRKLHKKLKGACAQCEASIHPSMLEALDEGLKMVVASIRAFGGKPRVAVSRFWEDVLLTYPRTKELRHFLEDHQKSASFSTRPTRKRKRVSKGEERWLPDDDTIGLCFSGSETAGDDVQSNNAHRLASFVQWCEIEERMELHLTLHPEASRCACDDVVCGAEACRRALSLNAHLRKVLHTATSAKEQLERLRARVKEVIEAPLPELTSKLSATMPA